MGKFVRCSTRLAIPFLGRLHCLPNPRRHGQEEEGKLAPQRGSAAARRRVKQEQHTMFDDLRRGFTYKGIYNCGTRLGCLKWVSGRLPLASSWATHGWLTQTDLLLCHLLVAAAASVVVVAAAAAAATVAGLVVVAATVAGLVVIKASIKNREFVV